MKLGSISSRFIAAILCHLLTLGTVFYLTPKLIAQFNLFKGISTNELALLTVLVASAAGLVGVSIGSRPRFYRSSRFWKHVSATLVVVNIIFGSHSLVFSGFSAFVDSAIVYYINPFVMTLAGLMVASIFAHAHCDRTNERPWQSLLAALVIIPVATYALGNFGSVTLAPTLALLVGLGMKAQELTEKAQRSSRPANVADIQRVA